MSPAAKSELTRAQLLALMAYADGEVDPRDLAALEGELASSPDSVEIVESIRGLGEHVRTGLPVAPDLTDLVMARVAATAAMPVGMSAPSEGAKVLDLAAARTRRVKIGAAVASFAAIAAAVALWIGHSAGSLVPGLGAELATAAMGVQVQQVDSQAMVYSIPALHSNASSVVVWLGDDTEENAAKSPTDAAPQPSTKASLTQ